MFLIKSFTFNPVQENTYLLYNESKQCLIIDPGFYFDHEKDEILDYIRTNALVPVKLMNTHCHFDHVFGNKTIAEKFNLTLHIHPLEKAVLDFAPASGLMFNLAFDNYTGSTHWLNEGDMVHLGEDKLMAIHVPGHSPGSLCFYCEAQQFLIGGDVLFRESVGRTDLPLGDGPALIENIRNKIFTLPDEVTVYPGHGPETTIGHEKRYNPFLN